MFPFLLVTVAAWYRFWAKRINSYKVVDPLKDSHCKLVGETPFSSLSQEDRISELPDEILSYILSHLTLSDTVRTSTLSRRWRYMWLTLPKLDMDWRGLSGYKGMLHDDDFELHKEAYVKRVKQVLRQYEEQDISSFRISFCFTKEYASHVDQWISVASTKRLESLTLQFICMYHYVSRLKSLWKRLKPDGWYIVTSSFLSQYPCLKNLRLDSCILKLHSELRLNKLVQLDLNYVFLEGIDHLQWMLTNSSTIKWLRLTTCNLPRKLCIGDNLRQLSCLMIIDCPDLLEIELNAKNLKTFEFAGEVAIKCSFLCATNLEFFCLSLYGVELRGIEQFFSNFAYSLSATKTLFLNGLISWVRELPTHPSTLLRHVVTLNLCFQRDDARVGIMKILPRLLKCSPQLQKLYLVLPWIGLSSRIELSAMDLHANLKEVELSNFRTCWIPCARYLLKSSMVLDRMVLTSCIRSYIAGHGWDHGWDRTRFPNYPLSKKDCNYVRNALQGDALSPYADLIIY